MRKCRYLEIANRRAADSPLVEEASRSEVGFFLPQQEMSFSTIVLVVEQYWSWQSATEMDWRLQSR